MRTLIDLPEDDMKWLDARAAERGKSRAALVREAVATYRARMVPAGDKSWIDAGFGLWESGVEAGDAVAWQRRERAGWTRPWDADYEVVKAEFPDLFDDADDRERAWHLEQQRKSA